MKTTILNDSNKKAVIYCRVSSKEQVDEGNSLASQERICREYALKEGYEIVGVYIEKGESAKTAKRKELQSMLAACTSKKGVIQAVIAYKVDRISRNIADYSYIRVTLKKYGVEIKSVTEYFEDTPAGRFMENIIANVGQFDNDVRAERCVDGMREAMYEGRYVWMAPTGYVNQKVQGKSTIVPTNIAPLVLETFELIASQRYSTEEVRLMMVAKGLVSKKGVPISHGHFFRLIRNSTYKGEIKKLGETHHGTYEPIVPEELFDEVQLILKGRANKTKHYIRDNPDFPLRRFVRSESGKQLTGYWSKGKRKKYPYYSFHMPGTTIRKEIVEGKFIEFLSQYSFDTVHISAMKKYLIQHFQGRLANQSNGREAIQSRIAELNKHIDHLIQLHADGLISASILANRTSKFDTELDELSGLLKKASKKEVNIDDLLRFAAPVLKQPYLLWQKSPLQKQKQFQVFGFPEGVIFNGNIFRTPKVCNVFKVKERIARLKVPMEDSKDLGKNTYSDISLPPSEVDLLASKEFWQTVVDELVSLKQNLGQ